MSLVGRRVVIEGIASKPELNGTKGVAVSFDDAKGRYNVRLESSGEFMALKPVNILAESSADSASGSGPGAGEQFRMPGMGSGMPGMGAGMPSVGGLAALLAQLMGKGGLPTGMSKQQLAMGAVAVLMMLRTVGLSRLLPFALLGGGAYIATRRPAARDFLQKVASAVGRLSGRPVSEAQTAVLLVGLLGVVYYVWFGGGDSSGAGGFFSADDAETYAAYTKGYQDGKRGAPFEPIADVQSRAGSSEPSSGSGWGLGKLMSLGMAGMMIYQLGGGGSGQPWSAQAAMANARNMNPMNVLILVNMLSGLF